jgi:hypothetical protein
LDLDAEENERDRMSVLGYKENSIRVYQNPFFFLKKKHIIIYSGEQKFGTLTCRLRKVVAKEKWNTYMSFKDLTRNCHLKTS